MTPADIIVMRILLFGIPAICCIPLFKYLRDLIVKPWGATTDLAIFVLISLIMLLPFKYGLNLYERYKDTDEYIERKAKKILAQQKLDSVQRAREARLEYIIENGGSTPYKKTNNDTNIARLQSEIDKIIKRCVECENKGESLYPSMTYEQGVRAAIEWMTGETNESPLEE